MDFKRLKTLNSGESARLNRVTQNLDKRKNNLEKELIDIQRARRIFEANKRANIVSKNEAKQNKNQETREEKNQDLNSETRGVDLNSNVLENQDIKLLSRKKSSKTDPVQSTRKSSGCGLEQFSTSTNTTNEQAEILENHVHVKDDLFQLTNFGLSLTKSHRSPVTPVSFQESNGIASYQGKAEEPWMVNRRPLRRSIGSVENTAARKLFWTSSLNQAPQFGHKPLGKSLSAGTKSPVPNCNEALPKIETDRKPQRKISLPDNQKFTTTRRRDSGKFVNTLNEISERDSSGLNSQISKDSLQLPGILQTKSKSNSDIPKKTQFEGVPRSRKLYNESDGVSPRRNRSVSVDYNSNRPITVPEIVCHHTVDGESILHSAFRRKKVLTAIELERASKSAEELDQILVGRFRRIGEGSMAEMFMRTKRTQSYEHMNRSEDELPVTANEVPLRQQSSMGNRLSLPNSMLGSGSASSDRSLNERPKSWNGSDTFN